MQELLELDDQRHAVIEALERVVRTRRSVRGFLPRPVAKETLKRVFELAQLSPSNCNVQPWRSYVASGESCARVRAALLARVDGNVAPSYDFSDGPNVFHDEYRERQVECAVALYSEMGIERGDRVGRQRAVRRNFELFDAPHVVFVGMHRSFGIQVALDVGIYLQTLMLAMTAHGIACCPQGALRSHPDVAREFFAVPDDIGILCGISFGYEDASVPANRTRVPRSPLDNNVAFFE